MSTFLTASEVCEVLSAPGQRFPYHTLDAWIRRGIVKPAVEAKAGRGARTDRLFSLTDVLAIAAGRGLRVSGFTLDVAGRATEVLMNIPERRLRKNFREERNYLVITTEDVLPQMVAADAVPRVGHGDFPLRPMALDVKRLFDNIVSRVRQLKAEKEQVAT